MLLDLNERLFILTIEKLYNKNTGLLCSLKELEKEIGVNEDFFISTIISMEKKKTIEIGFIRQNSILKVANWYSQYKERYDFYIKTTKKGLLQI